MSPILLIPRFQAAPQSFRIKRTVHCYAQLFVPLWAPSGLLHPSRATQNRVPSTQPGALEDLYFHCDQWEFSSQQEAGAQISIARLLAPHHSISQPWGQCLGDPGSFSDDAKQCRALQTLICPA